MSACQTEYGELCEAVNETCFQSAHVKPERGGSAAILREAVQVAAVAMAIAEAALRKAEKDQELKPGTTSMERFFREEMD